MSAPNTSLSLGDLRQAEAVLDRFEGSTLITDEAELLRGCLYALVAIGRHLYGHPSDEPPTT